MSNKEQVVITPEGEQALVERVFEAVTSRLEVCMDEAIKVAQVEASEATREGMESGLDAAAQNHHKAFDNLVEICSEKLRPASEEAERRMAHATEQVKQAVKDGVEVRKRVGELDGELAKFCTRLAEIASEAEAAAQARVAQAAEFAMERARKYENHVNAAGDFLTRVRNEQDRMLAYIDGMLQRGISPEALDGALKDLQKKQQENMATIQRIQEANGRRMDARRRYNGNGHPPAPPRR